MTQATPTQTAQALSEHLLEYARFLEVKENVLETLEAYKREGRIQDYLTRDEGTRVLYVRMVVPLEQYRNRELRSALMWEVSDLGLETGVLVDAFVRFADEPAPHTSS